MQCMIGDKQCDFITKRFIEKTSAMSPPEAHDYLRKSFKKPIIVDGSKYPSWLRIDAAEELESSVAGIGNVLSNGSGIITYKYYYNK